MKHSIENKEQQLNTLLSELLCTNPSETDSPLRLLAFVRLYGALFRFITINNNDYRYGNRREYTHRAETLFQMLFSNASSPKINFTERARLVSALYYLSTEVMPFYDAQREELAGEALAQLMDNLPEPTAADSVAQSVVCRCLASCFYPELCPDDDWSLYLFNTVRGWAETQAATGVWEGVSTDVALARIETMNCYSPMFLDNSYDIQIKQAYHHYVYSSSANETESLYTLACRYDLSMQSSVYPINWEMADATATIFYQHSRHYSAGSDEWCYCLSSYVVHLCEQITEYYQHEMLQSIA